jgi:hypothetical protein
MKREIDVCDHANHILKQLKKGVLITTKIEDKVKLHDNFMGPDWYRLGATCIHNVRPEYFSRVNGRSQSGAWG